jgi:hypothetical protein
MRFTSITCRNCSVVTCIVGTAVPTPALLTKISTRTQDSIAWVSFQRSIPVGSVREYSCSLLFTKECAYRTPMDFNLSEKANEYLYRLRTFMDSEIFPAEGIYHEQRQVFAKAGTPHLQPPIIEKLKTSARSKGLWNLFFA